MQLWMLGAAFALTGAPMVWLAFRVFARDRVIAGWPRVPGVVKSSRVESCMESYRDQDGYDRKTMSHRPIVLYTYQVDGQTLEGSRIHRTDDATVGEKAAHRTVAKYPAQKQVMVLRDPEDPKTAYLETQRSLGGIVLGAFGGFWIALGALLIGLSLL